MRNRPIGFSTGSLYRYLPPVSNEVVREIAKTGCDAIEICAIMAERIKDIKHLDPILLNQFEYISLHLPVDLRWNNDKATREILDELATAQAQYSFAAMVIHPDTVTDWSVFADYALPWAIENMDSRKQFGASVKDLSQSLEHISAKIVIDTNHAFTIDPSQSLARELVQKYADTITHFHVAGYLGEAEAERHVPLPQTGQLEMLEPCRDSVRPIIIESALQVGVEDIAALNSELALVRSAVSS